GPRIERLIAARPGSWIPAPDFLWGLGHILLVDRYGHPSYFLGRASNEGWPLYFPATIVLKTTLAVLLLIALGAWVARSSPPLRKLLFESATVALLLLAFCSRSRLDLGIRYILPLLVPFTVAAAAGATAMLRAGRAPGVIACLLLAWHAVVSITAHPDYF